MQGGRGDGVKCGVAAAQRSVTVVRRVASLFFQAEDGIRDLTVTGVQTCALPISIASMSESPVDRGEEWACRMLIHIVSETRLRLTCCCEEQASAIVRRLWEPPLTDRKSVV